MTRHFRLLGCVGLVIAFAVSSLTAEAQRRGTYRTRQQQIQQLVQRIQDRANILRSSLDASLDQSQPVDYNTSGRIDQLLSDLQDAIRHLRERSDLREASADDVRNVLDRAGYVERYVSQHPFAEDAASDWRSLHRDLNQLAQFYNIPANWANQPGNGTGPGGGPTAYGPSRLTGTYRLDVSRSDDPRDAANRAVQYVRTGDRQQTLDSLTRRLEAPQMLAIERRGLNVTIASSRAPQLSFQADGRENIETMPSGRTVRARATLNGDQLVVSTVGDASSDYTVTFSPGENGRILTVTRRITAENLDRPVVVQSTYVRTSDVAQFNVYNGAQAYPQQAGGAAPAGEFLVPDGTELVAVLNNDLIASQANDGDRFTMTVNQPAEYNGATIEGHVSGISRGGRVTGRTEMTLNFDRIMWRGRAYRFAGFTESVTTTDGNTLRVDTEGDVQGTNQTTRTEERAAIGTGLGAIIGAIAGGGKGAAIGALLGAGAGAGSVYVQGQNDLQLRSGSEVRLRATGPNR